MPTIGCAAPPTGHQPDTKGRRLPQADNQSFYLFLEFKKNNNTMNVGEPRLEWSFDAISSGFLDQEWALAHFFVVK